MTSNGSRWTPSSRSPFEGVHRVSVARSACPTPVIDPRRDGGVDERDHTGHVGRIAFGAMFALFASNFMTFWLPLVW
jgi:hypothetical protein